MSDPLPLRDGARRALVTGASSGIGAATARLLAAEGYRVALLARREDKLLELARDIASNIAPKIAAAVAPDIDSRIKSGIDPDFTSRPARASHAAPLVLRCDLSRPEEIEAAFAKLGREFGGLDLLVNNAGMGYRARVEELDPVLLRRLYDTNVIGLLLCCRSALPLLRRSARAVVVNNASVVGRRGIPGQSAYASSKAAVISIGEALRIEWAGENIAVCTLNPALTATGFFAAQPNPSQLAAPDMARSDAADTVARAILALDREPRAEVSLRPKWRWLALLSLVAPRIADRLLVRRLGERWTAPR